MTALLGPLGRLASYKIPAWMAVGALLLCMLGARMLLVPDSSSIGAAVENRGAWVAPPPQQQRLEAPRQPAAPEQPHEKPSEAAAVPQQQTAAGEPATRCSVAVCNIDQFPKEDRGKIVRHAAGIGPDDGTERDWVSEQQDELLAPGDTEEATHKLVVMVGSSPFRYAVARHWCAHHNASVCSPIWEPVRQSMDEQAFLGTEAQCGATHRRHVCTELCTASELCQLHETYYCVARPDPKSKQTVTLAYVHSGFGVHTSGPWNWHGCGLSNIGMYSTKLKDTPGLEDCDILHGKSPMADCNQGLLPAQYTSRQSADRAEAHHRLTGEIAPHLYAMFSFTTDHLPRQAQDRYEEDSTKRG
jgi:hypothetical protein